MLKFEKDFVLVDLVAENYEEVITALANRLHAAGLVEAGYGEATIERERRHATGLPTRPFPIAFPHADADGVVQSALAVATLQKPVDFLNMADPDEALPVELVIMLANKSPEEQIETLRRLAELFGEAEKLAELKSLGSADEIVDWMTAELLIG